MSATTNWGDVEQSIVAHLSGIIPATLRGATAATSESAADKQPSAFPWATVVIGDTGIVDEAAIRAGHLAETVRKSWSIFVYTATGGTEATSRYGANGAFAVATTVRERLLGFTPAGQVNNVRHLVLRGESQPEPFGGTGASKIRMDFSLDVLLQAVNT